MGRARSSGANFWLSNIGVGGGDDKDYQYDSPRALRRAASWSDSGIGQWAGDGAFNSQTGMIWRVAVGGDNCIHELDPVTRQPDGQHDLRLAVDRNVPARHGVRRDQQRVLRRRLERGHRLPLRFGRQHDRLGQRRSVRSRAWPTTRATVTSSSCRTRTVRTSPCSTRSTTTPWSAATTSWTAARGRSAPSSRPASSSTASATSGPSTRSPRSSTTSRPARTPAAPSTSPGSRWIRPRAPCRAAAARRTSR